MQTSSLSWQLDELAEFGLRPSPKIFSAVADAIHRKPSVKSLEAEAHKCMYLGWHLVQFGSTRIAKALRIRRSYHLANTSSIKIDVKHACHLRNYQGYSKSQNELLKKTLITWRKMVAAIYQWRGKTSKALPKNGFFVFQVIGGSQC